MIERETTPGTTPELPPEIDLALPPSVRLHMLFLSHEDQEVTQLLRNRIQECDVYIPEYVDWTIDDHKMLTSISKGDDRVLKKRVSHLRSRSLPNSFTELSEKALFGTWKPVLLVDIGLYHEVQKRTAAVISKIGHCQFLQSDLQQTVETYRQILEEFTSVNWERENYILSQLGPSLDKFITRHPKLKSKAQVKVFMWMGSGHIGLFNHLQFHPQNTGRVTCESREQPLKDLSYTDRLTRDALLGISLSDELIIKAVAEILVFQILAKEILSKLHPGPTAHKLLKSVVDFMNAEELKKLFATIESRDEKTGLIRFRQSLLITKLKESASILLEKA